MKFFLLLGAVLGLVGCDASPMSDSQIGNYVLFINLWLSCLYITLVFSLVKKNDNITPMITMLVATYTFLGLLGALFEYGDKVTISLPYFWIF